MQGEMDCCSSSPLSVGSSLKLAILRMRRGTGLSFVLGWEKLRSVERGEDALGFGCSCWLALLELEGQ